MDRAPGPPDCIRSSFRSPIGLNRASSVKQTYIHTHTLSLSLSLDTALKIVHRSQRHALINPATSGRGGAHGPRPHHRKPARRAHYSWDTHIGPRGGHPAKMDALKTHSALKRCHKIIGRSTRLPTNKHLKPPARPTGREGNNAPKTLNSTLKSTSIHTHTLLNNSPP